MTSGVQQSRHRWITGLPAAGRWLFLFGVFLMITGDGPSTSVRASSWRTPVPFLAWPWLHLVLIAVSVVCMAAAGGVTTWRPARLRFLLLPLGCLLTAFLLSTIFSQAPSLSAVAFVSVLGIAFFCWAVAVMIEDDRLAARVWPVTAVAVLLLAIRVIVWRRDEGMDVVAFQVMNNAWLGKLQLAWVFNLFAPLLLARSLGERRWRPATLYGAAWVAAGLATYLLFSRMGTLVFALSTLGVCLLNLAYWRRWLVILVAATLLGALPLARGVETALRVISTTFERAENPGVGIRLGVWRDALRLFRDHPITGAGLGTFDEVAYSLPGNSADSAFYRNGWHAHNVYLHVLAETGVLGLAAWCYLWYVIIAYLVRAWRHGDLTARLHAAAALCAVLAFLLLSTTEALIAARVHASLRMNLTLGLLVMLGLHLVTRVRSAPDSGPG